MRSSEFASLELRDVGRSFGGSEALVGLSLTIRAGEFIALLGPSGCGKSTALNLLAGLLPLTSGEIRIDGRRIDLLAPEKRDFGMVFQNYALFPHMSVERNVAFGLEMRKTARPETKQRVDEALRLVKLQEHARKLPGQLSGGQQQRVAIARAVVVQPRLVLMDEPLSNLDAKLRLEMRSEIRKLHDRLGLTTVYVTHDQEEALSMADRLVLLREGKVQQIAEPETVHREPANWHVADFMGYRNSVDGVLEAKSGRIVRVRSGKTLIEGTAAEEIPVGAAVRVAIRPEDIALGGRAGARNAFPARLSLSEFHGDGYALEVTTADGHTFFAQSKKVPGEKLVLTVPPDRALVFPSPATAAGQLEFA